MPRLQWDEDAPTGGSMEALEARARYWQHAAYEERRCANTLLHAIALIGPGYRGEAHAYLKQAGRLLRRYHRNQFTALVNQAMPLSDFRPDATLPAFGLIEYMQDLKRRSLPDDEFEQLVKTAHRAATDEVDRLDALVKSVVGGQL